MVEILEVAAEVAAAYVNNKTKESSKPIKQKNKNKKPVDKNELTSTKPGRRETTPPSPVTKVPEIQITPDINPENLLQGIIWSEILGKPVSKRRGRW